MEFQMQVTEFLRRLKNYQPENKFARQGLW